MIAIVLVAVSGFVVYSQFSNLQAQISELQAQNSQFLDQNATFQERIRELELENREKQDRLTDFTHELAKGHYLNVEITSFLFDGGFYPIVGVTLQHPVKVTVKNNEDIAVFGLTVSLVLVNKDTGAKISNSGFSATIDRINAGQSQNATCSAFTTLNTSLDNAACVVTLASGSIILDEWRQAIGS